MDKTLFDYLPQELPIAVEDLILVQCPCGVEDYSQLKNFSQLSISLEELNLLSKAVPMQDIRSPKNLVENFKPTHPIYELAFLNTQRTKYVLVREFHQEKIHEITKDTHVIPATYSFTKEAKFKGLYFPVSEDEMYGGIMLDKLMRENRNIIIKQLMFQKFKQPYLDKAMKNLAEKQEIYGKF